MTNPSAPPLRWRAELSGQDWKAFSAAWLGYAMDGFDFVLITLVLTEIAKDFRLSTLTAATLVSAGFGAAVLGTAAEGRGVSLASITFGLAGTAVAGDRG